MMVISLTNIIKMLVLAYIGNFNVCYYCVFNFKGVAIKCTYIL